MISRIKLKVKIEGVKEAAISYKIVSNRMSSHRKRQRPETSYRIVSSKMISLNKYQRLEVKYKTLRFNKVVNNRMGNLIK